MAGGKHNDNWDRSFPNNYGDYSPEQESIRQWHEELANRKLLTTNIESERKIWNKTYSGELRLTEADIIHLHALGVKYE